MKGTAGAHVPEQVLRARQCRGQRQQPPMPPAADGECDERQRRRRVMGGRALGMMRGFGCHRPGAAGPRGHGRGGPRWTPTQTTPLSFGGGAGAGGKGTGRSGIERHGPPALGARGASLAGGFHRALLPQATALPLLRGRRGGLAGRGLGGGRGPLGLSRMAHVDGPRAGVRMPG